MERFKVIVHYEDDYGYIEYDPTSKQATVVLPNEPKRRLAEEYLTSSQTIQLAEGTTLLEFQLKTFIPTDSLELFKQALTRMWEKTEVYVDWSRPIA